MGPWSIPWLSRGDDRGGFRLSTEASRGASMRWRCRLLRTIDSAKIDPKLLLSRTRFPFLRNRSVTIARESNLADYFR